MQLHFPEEEEEEEEEEENSSMQILKNDRDS
jgi:hypothetical protein